MDQGGPLQDVVGLGFILRMMGAPKEVIILSFHNLMRICVKPNTVQGWGQLSGDPVPPVKINDTS